MISASFHALSNECLIVAGITESSILLKIYPIFKAAPLIWQSDADIFSAFQSFIAYFPNPFFPFKSSC